MDSEPVCSMSLHRELNPRAFHFNTKSESLIQRELSYIMSLNSSIGFNFREKIFFEFNKKNIARFFFFFQPRYLFRNFSAKGFIPTGDYQFFNYYFFSKRMYLCVFWHTNTGVTNGLTMRGFSSRKHTYEV